MMTENGSDMIWTSATSIIILVVRKTAFPFVHTLREKRQPNNNKDRPLMPSRSMTPFCNPPIKKARLILRGRKTKNGYNSAWSTTES